MDKILLVEDYKPLREFFSRYLKKQNFDVETAVDGDALGKVREYRPEIVLLDFLLPDMTGVEVLKVLKTDPELKDIPVLILTSACSADDIEEYLQNEAIGCIAKYSCAFIEATVEKTNTLLRLIK